MQSVKLCQALPSFDYSFESRVSINIIGINKKNDLKSFPLMKI